MLTEVGKWLRRLRIERDELLLDMARKLGVTPSFLSAIEKGHKNAPLGFEDEIIRIYELSRADASELRQAADRSRDSFVLKPKTELGRDTAGLLARRMNTLSTKDLEEILGILKKPERK